jgi:DNA-binding MarR family transcriptional regulator
LTVAVRYLVLAVDRYRARVGRQRGLDPRAVTAMAHLRLDGPQTPGELARRLAITTASATDLVDRLHKLGLAERRAHPGDRRKLLVDLTDDGRGAIDDVLDGFAAGLARWADGRDPDAHATVLDFAREATRALLADPA